MLAQQVAKKYATALFEIAAERKLIDQAWEQFSALAQYLKKDETLINFMTAPQISDRKKKALVETAFKGRLEVPFFDFLQVLMEKRRFQYLPDIVDYLDELIREHKGLARAICLTAHPITDQERNALIAKLQKKTSMKIELDEKIDKSLIGGMVVMLHNQIIDGSIRYGLSQLKNRLMKVKVH
nr:F0F1 ATP synthase subunit delta [candidate division Zixibacteria bacterium]